MWSFGYQWDILYHADVQVTYTETSSSRNLSDYFKSSQTMNLKAGAFLVGAIVLFCAAIPLFILGALSTTQPDPTTSGQVNDIDSALSGNFTSEQSGDTSTSSTTPNIFKDNSAQIAGIAQLVLGGLVLAGGLVCAALAAKHAIPPKIQKE